MVLKNLEVTMPASLERRRRRSRISVTPMEDAVSCRVSFRILSSIATAAPKEPGPEHVDALLPALDLERHPPAFVASM